MLIKDPVSRNQSNSNSEGLAFSSHSESDIQLGIQPTKNNKEFISLISHNIKNPFGALLGYSELILEDYNEITDAERLIYLSEIKSAANYTYKYFERFLEWIYYKTGKVEIMHQKLNLREILVKATKKILNNNDFLGEVKFNIRRTIQVFADPESLIKIFYYILENALDYSRDECIICIFSKENNNFVEITIEDNGMGISEERLSKLFNPCQNLVSDVKGFENKTGLGLFLTEHYVKINRGHIKISSQENIGTTVSVKLPVPS